MSEGIAAFWKCYTLLVVCREITIKEEEIEKKDDWNVPAGSLFVGSHRVLPNAARCDKRSLHISCPTNLQFKWICVQHTDLQYIMYQSERSLKNAGKQLRDWFIELESLDGIIKLMDLLWKARKVELMQ